MKTTTTAHEDGYRDGLAWDLDGYESTADLRAAIDGWDSATINAFGTAACAKRWGVPDTGEEWERACREYNAGAVAGAIAPQSERTGRGIVADTEEEPTDRATEIYAASDPDFNPAKHWQRVARLAVVLAAHPDAHLEWCSDERTGCRYGQAKCRAGRCEKIGYTTYAQQVWAVWGGVTP